MPFFTTREEYLASKNSFKNLLDQYKNNSLKLKTILEYVNRKGHDKALEKFSQYFLSFSNLDSYYFSVYDLKYPDQLLENVLFLQNFNLDLKEIRFAYLVGCIEAFPLLDYMLENNLLRVYFLDNSSSKKFFNYVQDDLYALCQLPLKHFKKIVYYFNLDLHGIYGEDQLTLFYYISDNKELIDYLYLEGVDLYHDIRKKFIPLTMFIQLIEKIDLDRFKDEIIYDLLFDILQSVPKNKNHEKIVYLKLNERVLKMKRQDFKNHHYLLSLYREGNYLRGVLKRFVEENIEVEQILYDFADIDFNFNFAPDKHYQLLIDIYKMDERNEMEVDFAKIDKYFEKYYNYNEHNYIEYNYGYNEYDYESDFKYFKYQLCYIYYILGWRRLDEELDKFIENYLISKVEENEDAEEEESENESEDVEEDEKDENKEDLTEIKKYKNETDLATIYKGLLLYTFEKKLSLDRFYWMRSIILKDRDI